MGRLPDYYEVGNYGDGREEYAVNHVTETVPFGDSLGVLEALEQFHQRWSLLHVGPEKGQHLDKAVDAILMDKRTVIDDVKEHGMKSLSVTALEVGSYIGYSAIRIGRLFKEFKKEILSNFKEKDRERVGEAVGAEYPCEEVPQVHCHVYSLEQNAENVEWARRNVKHAGLEDFVTILHGSFDQKENLEFLVEKFNLPSHASCSTATSVDHDQTQNANSGADLVFLDHMKSQYLYDLRRLESLNIVRHGSIVVADNVAGLEHLANRRAAIARGKRKRECRCVNKGCNFRHYVRSSGRYEAVGEGTFYGRTDAVEICRATKLDPLCLSLAAAATSPVDGATSQDQ